VQAHTLGEVGILGTVLLRVFFRDSPSNLYWNRFTFDGGAKNKLVQFFETRCNNFFNLQIASAAPAAAATTYKQRHLANRNEMRVPGSTAAIRTLLLLHLFTQPPMRRMRICYTDVFFCFLLFPFAKKIPDNRSRERLNGFSWNFYQTIAGKMEFASPYPNGG